MRTLLVRIVEHLGSAWLWLRAKVAGATVDVSQINHQIWAGGAIETRTEVNQLLALGITADIDCQEEHDEGWLVLNRLAYLWDPATDDGQPKSIGWFGLAWKFAQPILESGGVILCHCQQGHNRGPSMAYFLLRAHTGMKPADALALVKAGRPVATVAYAPDADRAITALGLDKS